MSHGILSHGVSLQHPIPASQGMSTAFFENKPKNPHTPPQNTQPASPELFGFAGLVARLE